MSPLRFDPHPLWLAVAVALAAGYGVAVSRPRWRATRRQVVSFAAGDLLLLVAVGWPLGDLAAHWFLSALVAQRLLLTVAVAPLLLIGVPRPLMATLTRPGPTDSLSQTLSRPVPAVVVVTVVSVGTLTTPAVAAQASSPFAGVLLDLLLLGAGIVLWLPVLGHLPGARRLPPIGQAAYLVVQSIVPSFLSVVWILARHPLYPTYRHHPDPYGLAPLTDQVVAGFLAKLTTIAVLWTVAFVIVNRAVDPEVDGTDQLTWTDVERELERADRRSRTRRPGPAE